MALTTRTRLYEILVRFGPSGFQGAHAIDIDEIVDGDEVKAAKELPARPITSAEMSEMLGNHSAALIEAADAARAAAREADARATRAAHDRDAAVRAAEEWQKQAEELAKRLKLRAELDALKAAASEIRGEARESTISPSATVIGDLPAGSVVGDHSVVVLTRPDEA